MSADSRPTGAASAESRRFRSGEDVMVITESGGPGGPVFVLVHGIGMGHRVFRELADVLGRHGKVIAVDLPGFGDAPEPRRASSMSASGELLAEFVEREGLVPAVLVGHSMGAQVVVEAAARNPSCCSRLVLIAPTVNDRERTVLRQAWRLLQDVINERPQILWLGVVHYLKAGPRWYTRKLRAMLEHRIEEVVPVLAQPTLVVRGEHDRVCPADWARRLTGLIPEGRLVEIADRGHEAMITAAEPVASRILDHVGVGDA